MLPSTNRKKHGTPPTGHCQLLLDSPREEFLRCQSPAELEASLIAAVKRKVAKVTRRLVEKNRGTQTTPALAQPPAVPKDERGDASENCRSVQQQHSDQTPAHSENKTTTSQQANSKSDAVHGYRVKVIANYKAPTNSTPTTKAVTFDPTLPAKNKSQRGS